MAYKSVNGKLVKVNHKTTSSALAAALSFTAGRLRHQVQDRKEVLAADKGIYGGACNITHCQRPQSAFWYNHSTRKYYCRACAADLNYDRFNYRDSMEMWGHFLCTEGVFDSATDYRALHEAKFSAERGDK